MLITCSVCRKPLPGNLFNTGQAAKCPNCGARTMAWAFPSTALGPGTGMPSPAKTDDAQAGCFFHPHKVAETVCAHCGRFICPLCRMDLEGGPLCPTCLENGLKDHRLEHLETSRFLNDRLALFLALGPILFFPMWIITAPAAIIVAIRFWNSPTSILPRTKARYIISILVALAELALWAAWIRELMS